MSNQKKLTISILGKSYSLVTDEREEIVNQAAKMLDSLLQRAVGNTTPSPEALRKTTFVALQLAVDFVKKQQELDACSDKAETLNGLLKQAGAAA